MPSPVNPILDQIIKRIESDIAINQKLYQLRKKENPEDFEALEQLERIISSKQHKLSSY